MSSSNLEQAILEAITFFDLFAYPLTTFQIWQKLRTGASYREVQEALEKSAYLQERVEHGVGKWFLKGRMEIGRERARRYRFSKYKFDRASRFTGWLRWVPSISGVYACNSLGFFHAHQESDIDLFIVTRPGRIWMSRFFAALLAKLFFTRPRGSHTQDAICLSFFASEDADMQELALPQGDVYYEYWLKNLLPLWEKGRTEKMVKQGKKGDLVEMLLKRVQLWIMPIHLKELAGKGTSVVLSNKFLKFHDHDKREYFKREYERRVAQVAV